MKSLRILKMRQGLIALLAISSIGTLGMSFNSNNMHVSAHRVASYDISQWQGHLHNHQIKKLKKETHFMIIRGEYGSRMKDYQVSHNAKLLQRNNIPYGTYDYSIYHNKSQAKQEAKLLYQRVPKADFYINDAEEDDAGPRFNTSTKEWANEIHRVSHKPAILYSDLAFMNRHMTKSTRHSYNANWIAAYSNYQPRPKYHYDLWQYTSHHHSSALKQNVDANIIPRGSKKPMSFWTGNIHNHKTEIHKAPQMHQVKSIAVHFKKL